MRAEPVQGDELKSRQAVLTGGYARSLETNGGFSGKISAMIAIRSAARYAEQIYPFD